MLSPTVNPASLTNDLMTFHPRSKVLVVEDDLAYQWLVSKNLEAKGIDCVLVPNAQEALSRVRSGSFDLILMDIQLPGGVSGLDTAQRIRAFDAATPIVSMTSATAPRQIASYLAGGMNDVLPKPFSRDGLLSLVGRFCDLQLGHGVVQPIEEIFTDDILGSATSLTSVGNIGTGRSLYVFGAPI
jgi:CheY-like chemotaxis protein